MGIGDEIMVTGEVRKLALAQPGVRVAIRDMRKPVWHRWHPMWNNNPHIALPGRPYDLILDNAPGCRPYIAAKSHRAWVWQEYGPERGEIFLSDPERALGRDMGDAVVIQPFIKASASPNKQWPVKNWQALIDLHPDWRWVQVGDGGDPTMSGVEFVRTLSFREACGIIAGARAVICQEGALHHAAAALGIPCVVIFGGFISPQVTGYASQRSLYVASDQHELGCGLRTPCFHCHRAMLSIRPEHVAAALMALLGGQDAERA